MNDMTQPADKATTFPVMLKNYASEIARALPKHMDGDRMARIALTEFRKNPKLADCEPKSVFAAVIVAAQLGLEPGVLGQAYLVPYKVSKKVRGEWQEHFECQLIPGWQGYADLVARAGRASVWTGAVYQGDEFDYTKGDRPFITHKELAEDQSEAKLTHCYAVGRIKDSDWAVIEVWTVKKIRAHLGKYNKQGEKHYALKGNLEMYGRKVALLQVIKYMPKSPDLGTAVTLEHTADGKQNLTDAKSVIDGTWAPAPDEEEDQPGAVAESEAAGKPTYPEDQFKKNLNGWLKLIADGTKSSDDIIATLESKHALTPAQKAALAPPSVEPDAPASAEALAAMREKAEEKAIGDSDIAKHLGIKTIDGSLALTNAQVESALAFIANPVPAKGGKAK